MRGWGLKFDVTYTMALLLVIGMLLTDFVITGFWRYQATQRQFHHLADLLTLTTVPINNYSTDFSPDNLVIAELNRQKVCLLLSSDKDWNRLIVNTCPQDREAKELVQAAFSQGNTGFSMNNRIAVVQALYHHKQMIGLIGLVKQADDVQPFMMYQNYILVYILINAIILTIVGFFRISRRVIRPLDRLITVADNYQQQESVLFSTHYKVDEINSLSMSLNSMVQRIENDKLVLKQTVEELAQKNKQLLENQQEMIRAEKLASVGRLAAGLAHEIGNPLGVAQGYLQLLGMENSGKDERIEYVTRALKELERVNGLIHQLLDYARTSKCEPEQFDLHLFLSELAESMRAQPFLNGIRLDLILQVENTCVLANREQLRQVLLNCLLNAADAIRVCKQKGEGMISLTTAPAEPLMLQLAIEDNGEGIRPELLDIVFDPFFTTKEPGAGTGLGLSVSLALIESIGGTIRLQSVAGEGTTVLLTVPLATEVVSELESLSKENNDNAINPPGSKNVEEHPRYRR